MSMVPEDYYMRMEMINTSKRYWVFAYDRFYPLGGLTDIVLTSNNILFIQKALKHIGKNEIYEGFSVYDKETNNEYSANRFMMIGKTSGCVLCRKRLSEEEICWHTGILVCEKCFDKLEEQKMTEQGTYSARLFNKETNSSSTMMGEASLEEYIGYLQQWKDTDCLVLLKTSFHQKKEGK